MTRDVYRDAHAKVGSYVIGFCERTLGMAAVPKNRRPELLSKLEGHTGTVNRAIIVRGEDAVITVSDDK